MKTKIFLFALLQCCILRIAAVEINTFPYTIDFEGTPLSDWQFKTTSNAGTSSWTIGAAQAYRGNNSLYVSADNGNSACYTDTKNNSYTIIANLPVKLPVGRYKLSFHYKAYGAEMANDYTWNYNDYMSVGWSQVGWYLDAGNYQYYPSYNEDGSQGVAIRQMAYKRHWTYQELDIDVRGDDTYYLSFYWTVNGDGYSYQPGCCIDEICISSRDVESCIATPMLFSSKRDDNNTVLSWSGNASEYQLQYYSDNEPNDNWKTINNITSTTYAIQGSSFPEGSYNFRLRGICGNDTSAWTALNHVLVYDIGKHCLDYLNFTAEGVKPEYGLFSNPTYYKSVYDNGFYAHDSRHTVHYVPYETDYRTGDKLHTTPNDEVASVRLGNWKSGSEAEAITYTLPPITEDNAVLLMKYAVVMQVPGHTAEEQPRFTLELLDSVGVLIDERCGVADFTASTDLQGWNQHTGDDGVVVVWKDWTMIGVNMLEYLGQSMQIRLTTKDCANGEHYGYAYFSLGCSTGRIEGASCGQKPEVLTAPEGFYYRWYKQGHPETVLSRERDYHLTNPYDTCTYSVDLIQMTDTLCYFTLNISSLAFAPKADATLVHDPMNCVNYVQVKDSSRVIGFYYDENGNKAEINSTDGCESYYWDFGAYGTSTERNPRIAMPDEGGLLHATLIVTINNDCADTLTIDYQVPAIGVVRTMETHYMCEGHPIEVYGKTYTEPTEITTTFKSWTGCDSLFTISIKYFEADTVHYYDTVCPLELPITWNGLTIEAEGEYETSLLNYTGWCDSIVDILHLIVRPVLDIELSYEEQAVCQSELSTLHIPFMVNAGFPTTYDFLMDELLKTLGYEDIIGAPLKSISEIEIPMDKEILAGNYTATLIIHNADCDLQQFTINFGIAYDAEEVITQRWNDLLSVRQSAYDYYGGFSTYQWYKNGQPLEGENNSQLYLNGNTFADGDTYSIMLTRSSDGVSAISCEFVPTIQTDELSIVITPSMISRHAPVPLNVRADSSVNLKVYNTSGNAVLSAVLPEGIGQIQLPQTEGIYLVHAQTNYQNVTYKVVVY